MKALITAMLLAFASQTSAGLMQLCDINSGLSGTPCVDDTGQEFFGINDTDGVDDDITSFLLDRNADYSNASGIYDPFNTSNYVELWGGTIDSGFSSGRVLDWDGVDTYTVSTGGSLTLSNSDYSSYFGLYLDDGNGNRYYSDSSLNLNGDDYLMTYLTEGLGGDTNGFDIIFAWEDFANLGDMDYNDMIYGCIDCTGISGITQVNQVPEPAPLFLMGAGLVLMARQLRKHEYMARKASLGYA